MPEDESNGPEGASESSRSAPVDYDIVDRIGHRLEASDRFEAVDFRPAYAPNSAVVDYDLGYFPRNVERAYLRIRWYENDDFTIHYSEQYENGDNWECRWDRHPNSHNSRDHLHPPPDAETPGEDRSFAADWRDVLAEALAELDTHVERLWE